MKKSTAIRRQLFISLGLAEKEAVLYDILLKRGQMPAAGLEKISGLGKNTYILLKQLEKRGLVQKYISDGHSHYQAGSPDKLKAYLEEQLTSVRENKALLDEMMPTLKNEYASSVNRPVVSYYQGRVGLRAVFDEVYKEGKLEVLSCVGNEAPDPSFYEEIVNKYKPLRVKNKIFARTISPDSPRARELKSTENNDLKEKFLVDSAKYPMPAEFDSWDDKIAMMSFSKEDFSAILIQHPDLARTMQSLMQLAMDGARKKERGTHEK